MKNNRKQYSAAFKSEVALIALSQLKTIAQISEEYELHPTQISKWKNTLAQKANIIFSDKRKIKDESTEKKVDELYRQVGKLKVENDWLKKKVGLNP